MPLYIDPTGEPTYGIAICGRCSRKFPLAQLHPDPNTPGLMVCEDDLDEFDPYRLPARQTENISLPFTRPDVPLTYDADAETGFLALATEEWGIVILTENGRYIQLEGIEE
jgi:hypothetical protein